VNSNNSEVVGESQTTKLSWIIENSLGIELCKTCNECGQALREEELLSGLGKNKSKYTINCPICKGEFVPKMTLYSENVS
jgi:NAD-dependent SIR2 family protein deacetylase